MQTKCNRKCVTEIYIFERTKKKCMVVETISKNQAKSKSPEVFMTTL